MVLLFATMLILIAAGLVALHFFVRMRQLNAVTVIPAVNQFPLPNRYQPMLRLLSVQDDAFVAANKSLAQKFRKQRIKLFREYLSCLKADYGRLLAGLRFAMVKSGVDRPDIAAALAKNKALFALALCRIEYRLFLHNLGLGTVDVSGLVEAISVLRVQVSVITPAMGGVR